MSPVSAHDILGNIRTEAQKREAKKHKMMSIELNAATVYAGLRQSPTASERVLMLLPQTQQREFLLQTGRFKEGQLIPVPMYDRIRERQQEIREGYDLYDVERQNGRERKAFEQKITQDTVTEFIEADKKRIRETARTLAKEEKGTYRINFLKRLFNAKYKTGLTPVSNALVLGSGLFLPEVVYANALNHLPSLFGGVEHVIGASFLPTFAKEVSRSPLGVYKLLGVEVGTSALTEGIWGSLPFVKKNRPTPFEKPYYAALNKGTLGNDTLDKIQTWSTFLYLVGFIVGPHWLPLGALFLAHVHFLGLGRLHRGHDG